MCGIVGLYLKNPGLQGRLGALFEPMLLEMSERGPDSAGFAVYRNPAPAGAIKLTLAHHGADYDWKALDVDLERALDCEVRIEALSNHAVLVATAEESRLRDWLRGNRPELHLVGAGRAIEIFKEVGLPGEVAARFGLAEMAGTHAIGHTRMATESAVTTEGSHPFATGDDLCLVHNGSLSNHNRLRDWLRRHASLRFETENDTEVAAAYFTWKLRSGLDLRQAFEAGLHDLDGFYTFVAGTADGFAVLRDPIACKPAVMAETEDFVAFGSEYRSLATLPGIERARVWEPAPAVVYSWQGTA